MSEIGKFAMGESVCREQVAKLIVGAGLRNAENRNKPDTKDDNAETDQQDGEGSASGQASEYALNRMNNRRLMQAGSSARKE